MNARLENPMVLGLPAALERQYGATATISAAAIEIAEERVLCEIDTLAGEIGMVGASDLRDSAERMLRLPHRADEADLDLLLAGAMLAAHRGDAEGAFTTLQKSARRYLAQQGEQVLRVAGGAA